MHPTDETAPRAALDHLRSILEAMFDPFVEVEAVRSEAGDITDFVLRDVNHAFETYVGRPRSDVLDRSLTAFLGRSARPDLLDAYIACVEAGVPVALDRYQYVHPATGEEIWFDVRGTRVGDGLWLTWHDVTAHQLDLARVATTEAELRAAVSESHALQEQLEQLLAASSTVAVRWTDDGTVTRVSASIEPLLGYSPGELRGRGMIEIRPSSDVGIRIAHQAEIRRTGSPRTFTLSIRHRDGTPRTFEGLVVPAPGEEDTAFEALFTDVTDRDRLQRQQALMVAATGHELRTPLAFVSAAAAMLERGDVTADSDTGRDLLRRMVDSSRRMARMADDLLDLQRLERPDATQALRIDGPVDVGACVVEAATLVANARSHPVAVRSDGVGPITADRSLLIQAVTNLLDNAIRHSPTGVPVEVAVTVADGTATVRVRDHGPGIAPDQRTLVFEPFHRGADEAPSPGAGLGLAIVARIAAAHRGRAWFEDAPDGPGIVAVLQVTSVADDAPGDAERPSGEGR